MRSGSNPGDYTNIIFISNADRGRDETESSEVRIQKRATRRKAEKEDPSSHLLIPQGFLSRLIWV